MSPDVLRRAIADVDAMLSSAPDSDRTRAIRAVLAGVRERVERWETLTLAEQAEIADTLRENLFAIAAVSSR